MSVCANAKGFGGVAHDDDGESAAHHFGDSGVAGVIAYEISIEPRPNHIHVTVTGESSTQTISRYVREIREACIRLQTFKVLAVVNLHGPAVSMLDLYKVISESSDESAGIGIRTAYVELNPNRSDANMHMAENVAIMRGIPVRTFRDVAAAEAWLLAP